MNRAKISCRPGFRESKRFVERCRQAAQRWERSEGRPLELLLSACYSVLCELRKPLGFSEYCEKRFGSMVNDCDAVMEHLDDYLDKLSEDDTKGVFQEKEGEILLQQGVDKLLAYLFDSVPESTSNLGDIISYGQTAMLYINEVWGEWRRNHKMKQNLTEMIQALIPLLEQYQDHR